jgi:ABC-type transport system substrate-binding protein
MQKYMPYDWLETAKGNFTGVAGSPYAGQLIEYPLDPSIYDPEVSKKILEGLGFNKVGGWWTSPNGTKCEWTLLNMMVFAPTTIAATQYVGEALREFGFDVVVKSPSFAETTQACQMMQFDLCQGWLQQPVHPSNPQVFWPKFYSKAWVGLPTSISSNFYHYNNSKFDELYLEGQVTSDQDPRYIELQKEIFKLLLVDMPSIPDGQSYIVHPVNNYYWTNWPTSGDPQNPDPSLLYAWPGHFQAHAHFVELNLVSTGRGQSTTGSVEPTIWGIPTTSFYIAIAVIVIVSVSAGYLVYRRRSVYQKKRQT